MSTTLRMPAEVEERYKKLAHETGRSASYFYKKALTGGFAGLWRYRVGDYRIVCDIEDGELVVLVVDVAHRSRIYKRS